MASWQLHDDLQEHHMKLDIEAFTGMATHYRPIPSTSYLNNINNISLKSEWLIQNIF